MKELEKADGKTIAIAIWNEAIEAAGNRMEEVCAGNDWEYEITEIRKLKK